MADTGRADTDIDSNREKSADLTAMAAVLLKTYQGRDRVFGGDLFNAPAWEILLILQCTGLPLSDSELCQAVNTPLATLQRWIRLLMHERLVRLSYRNGQRLYRLSDKASAGLESILRAAFTHRAGPDNPFENQGDMIDALLPALRNGLHRLKSNDDA